MPIGIQRLNARHQHPNTRITFIKPLPGPTSALAQDFLERIAAICKPIMAANHLSITTLEEYEPNPEFVGRNFNNGEIIQLVLRARHSDGHWLSFRSVQMVMMHELAHCLQMNHSGAFWKVRNQYAAELRELWRKDYTGDGFWGKGKTLLSDQYVHRGGWEEEVMPRSLCGGTFRSRRGKKRKKGSGQDGEISWSERRRRRIERKFGKNGTTLGGEEETRSNLEKGKKTKGKPRVAGSARGRELRAAAALARFGTQKEETAKMEKNEEEETEEEEAAESDSGTETDLEDVKPEQEAVDIDGSRLLDGNGHAMVKVCEEEDQNRIHVKEELEELQQLADIDTYTPPHAQDIKEEDNTTPRRSIPKRKEDASKNLSDEGQGRKHANSNDPLPHLLHDKRTISSSLRRLLTCPQTKLGAPALEMQKLHVPGQQLY
ncbi:MAG: hypothetical protein LQ342_004044 [Letrouitia transgressa]|nr:MAG: hypothetical protein LQ342_004044 [Letrouitia transgressa]